jgi:polysaccharide chain length determinant protein (PEP-CTERM system associated)
MHARTHVSDDNVMQALNDQARRVMRSVRRRRALALAVAGIVFVAWSAAVTRVPERYEASARVFVDTQTVLKPLMAGLTFQPDIDLQVRMLARTLVSRENVERMIAMPQLGLKTSAGAAHEALVAALMDRVQVTPTSSTNLYDITYRGSSAASARGLVEAMVGMFVDSGAATRQTDSRQAERFIDQQISDYEATLTQSENRLRDFKNRNFGLSGVPGQDYFSRISSMTDEVDKLRSDLAAAERASQAYRRQLDGQQSGPAAGEDPDASAIALRLETQRRTLDDLLRRDTEAHPEVIGTRHLIAQLESDYAQRVQSDRRDGASASVARVSIGDPVYQKLRVALADSQSQAAALQSRVASAQARLAAARAEAGRIPAGEAELAQLNRDYDVIRKNYELMVARRESALLGARLDQSAPLAEFRVIDPARVSSSPAFPGRLHLTIIGAVAALVLGALAAWIADHLWPTIHDAMQLRALTGRPVLGSVSRLASPRLLRKERKASARYGAAFAALIASQILWITWLAVRTPLG